MNRNSTNPPSMNVKGFRTRISGISPSASRRPASTLTLRAWVHAGDDRVVQDSVKAWLSNPEELSQPEEATLFENSSRCSVVIFLDTRPEWQFYADEVFLFHTGGHRQSWDALADLHRLAVCSGYRGLVLLVDEFEDVIQNLPRRNYQQMAFHNLFRFFAGDRFPGRAYFAVTPDFTHKCKRELLGRGVYDFDYGRFDKLPFFRLNPIEVGDVFLLARRIREVHGIAYGWERRRRNG